VGEETKVEHGVFRCGDPGPAGGEDRGSPGAARAEQATTGLARRVLRYLFQARHEPGLRFPF